MTEGRLTDYRQRAEAHEALWDIGTGLMLIVGAIVLLVMAVPLLWSLWALSPIWIVPGAIVMVAGFCVTSGLFAATGDERPATQLPDVEALLRWHDETLLKERHNSGSGQRT